jgi:hypothetical protein
MTDTEIDNSLQALIAAKPISDLVARAMALKEQTERDTDAATLPDISTGILANWDAIKAWLLNGTDGPRDIRKLAGECKQRLTADQMLILLKASLRAFPDV